MEENPKNVTNTLVSYLELTAINILSCLLPGFFKRRGIVGGICFLRLLQQIITSWMPPDTKKIYSLIVLEVTSLKLR